MYFSSHHVLSGISMASNLHAFFFAHRPMKFYFGVYRVKIDDKTMDIERLNHPFFAHELYSGSHFDGKSAKFLISSRVLSCS